MGDSGDDSGSGRGIRRVRRCGACEAKAARMMR